MSERWQDELKKLRGVETPSGLWDRAQQTPIGDRLPPRRERIVAGVVALVVFVAAGVFAFEALRESNPTNSGAIGGNSELVANFFVNKSESLGAEPSVTLRFGRQSILGVGTSYCWLSLCVDTVPPDLSGRQALRVPSGTRLRVTGDATTVDGFIAQGDLNQLDILRRVKSIDDGLVLDMDPGRYVLELTGNWAQGGREFYFPLDIVEAGSGPSPGADSIPNVAQVVCDEGQAAVSTPIVAAQSDGVHLLIDNRSGATSYELLTSQSGTGVGGQLKLHGETDSGGISIEPGEVKVACLPTTSKTYLDQFTASFTVVDPEGLWIPTEPSCEGKVSESSTGLAYSVPTQDQIVESLVGVLESDEIVQPGYPETEWMVVNLVVQRNGMVVADVWVAGGLHLKACDDSGIALASTS